MVLPVGKDGLPAYFGPFLNPFSSNFLAGVAGGGRRNKTSVAPLPPVRGAAEAKTMTPARAPSGLASQSHTAGRSTGPSASEFNPRPWITSSTRRPAARALDRKRSSSPLT